MSTEATIEHAIVFRVKTVDRKIIVLHLALRKLTLKFCGKMKTTMEKTTLGDKVVLEVKLSRQSEATPEAFATFLSNFASVLRSSFFENLLGREPTSISLEIACFEQSVHFYLVIPESLQSYAESQIEAQYPAALIVPQQDYLWNWVGKYYFLGGQLTLAKPYYYPIKNYQDFKDVDPLASVLGAIAKAKADEVFLVQYILTSAPNNWGSAGFALISNLNVAQGEHAAPVQGRALIQNKISHPAFKVSARIMVGAAEGQTRQQLLSSLVASFGNYSQGEGNYLTFHKGQMWQRKKLLKAIFNRKFHPSKQRQYLNIQELASLYHFPSQALQSVHNISWGTSIASEPPENLPTADSIDKETINFFGKTHYKNKMVNFGIRLEDRRRHMYIVGKTGTGKSTLIANMVIDDIRNGRGVGVIDPHGDLCEVLLDYIPKNRINDVVYLDPSNKQRTFVLNPLEVSEKSQKELVVSGIIAIFQKMYAHTWGPRLEHILRNSLFTIIELPNATFLEIPRFLTEKRYRDKFVEKIEDPVIRNFWFEEFDGMSPKLQSEAISPILNKVGQFLSAGSIRNVVGKPNSTIDLEKIMNEGKIVMLNLSQGKLGEDSSSLLGAMFITKFQLAAMNRVNVDEQSRRDFFLYVDEFQNFATTSFIKILSEARKYRLNLTLANQYMAQVSLEVSKAIMGNVGNLASFIVGADDARILSKEYGEVYSDNDLTSLDRYQTAVKLTINNHISRPFLAYTLPLPNSSNQNRQKVIQSSTERYTKPV